MRRLGIPAEGVLAPPVELDDEAIVDEEVDSRDPVHVNEHDLLAQRHAHSSEAEPEQALAGALGKGARVLGECAGPGGASHRANVRRVHLEVDRVDQVPADRGIGSDDPPVESQEPRTVQDRPQLDR